MVSNLCLQNVFDEEEILDFKNSDRTYEILLNLSFLEVVAVVDSSA